jgi:uncharacterized protein YfiM (DUF2279 family)
MPANLLRSIFVAVFVLWCTGSWAKTSTDKISISDTSKPIYHSDRVRWVVTGHVVVYAASLTGLSVMWYSNQPRSSFHFFNDDNEWLQVDKAGHFYSAYEIARASHALWNWAGLPRKKAIWIGGLSGLAFQSIIEVLDGFSAEYGFSVGDYVANVAGAGLFIGQQFGWNEQRFKLKFSSTPRSYAEPDLKARAAKVYGSSLPEKVLKDYNHQTYWLSANIHTLFKSEKWPEWLNLAVGYGADGMFGGNSNISRDQNGKIVFDRSDIRRFRQWYLSPDLDFSKIKTKKKGVKVLLLVLDAFKLPAPALELSKGKLKGHWIFF